MIFFHLSFNTCLVGCCMFFDAKIMGPTAQLDGDGHYTRWSDITELSQKMHAPCWRYILCKHKTIQIFRKSSKVIRRPCISTIVYNSTHDRDSILQAYLSFRRHVAATLYTANMADLFVLTSLPPPLCKIRECEIASNRSRSRNNDELSSWSCMSITSMAFPASTSLLEH